MDSMRMDRNGRSYWAEVRYKAEESGRKRRSRKKPLINNGRRWTKREDERLREAVVKLGEDWESIALEWFQELDRTAEECEKRWQGVLREGLVKGAFTEEEDAIIAKCMNEGGLSWMQIAARIPGRIGKQCRERWTNHLDPNLKRGNWTLEEDVVLVVAQKRWGNSWTKIADLLSGRAENAVKNRWNSAFRRNNASTFGIPGNSARAHAAIDRAIQQMDAIDQQAQHSYRGTDSNDEKPIYNYQEPTRAIPSTRKVDRHRIHVMHPPPRKNVDPSPHDYAYYHHHHPRNAFTNVLLASQHTARLPLERPVSFAETSSTVSNASPRKRGPPDGLDLLGMAIASEQWEDSRASLSSTSDYEEESPPEKASQQPFQKRQRVIADWCPRGFLTADQIIKRYPEIHNCHQLKDLEQFRVTRPESSQAHLYDETTVAQFAASLAVAKRQDTTNQRPDSWYSDDEDEDDKSNSNYQAPYQQHIVHTHK